MSGDRTLKPESVSAQTPLRQHICRCPSVVTVARNERFGAPAGGTTGALLYRRPRCLEQRNQDTKHDGAGEDEPRFTPSLPAAMSPAMFFATVLYVAPPWLFVPTAAATSSSLRADTVGFDVTQRTASPKHTCRCCTRRRRGHGSGSRPALSRHCDAVSHQLQRLWLSGRTRTHRTQGRGHRCSP